MVKNNYNLEYYNQYDYIQKNLITSPYNGGIVKKIRISFIEKNSVERNINLHMKTFLCAYTFNEHFPLVNKQIKNLMKNGESIESSFLENTCTNKAEILSFLKYMYFESLMKSFSKDIRFFSSKNNNYIRLSIPAENMIKIQDVFNYFDIDLKNVFISFEFYIDHNIQNKNELANVFPFWMNG